MKKSNQLKIMKSLQVMFLSKIEPSVWHVLLSPISLFIIWIVSMRGFLAATGLICWLRRSGKPGAYSVNASPALKYKTARFLKPHFSIFWRNVVRSWGRKGGCWRLEAGFFQPPGPNFQTLNFYRQDESWQYMIKLSMR